LEPAIRFAAAGFVVNEELARGIEKSRRKLQQFPATAELFVPDGEPLAAGDTLVQPELARTLRLLASSGPLAFYEGEIAEALVGEMERGGGLITRDDLLSYRAVERRPLRGRYRDVEILCAPPPSSGGVTLLQMLALLERFELKTDEPSSPTNVHLTVEVMARAFSDRNTFLGDPGFVRVPVQGLLSPAYIETRRRSISVDRATPSRFVSAGEVWRFEPGALPAPGRGARPGRDSESQHAPEPEAPAPGSEAPEDSTGSAQRAGVLRESDNTTHFSIVDPEGNAVALTTTLNSGFGSGVLVQGAGFLLNNEMDDFDARPGHPNQFGLVGGGSNAVAPGKRMLSSMSPTLVLRDGDPWLVLGARGGPRIITAILQILLNVCEFDMDLAEAVAAKRYHHQWLPDVIRYEEGAIQGDTYESLKRMGHELRVLGPSKSSAQCIEITPEGIRRGVSDPRTQGGAAGY
ncbi:MAG: gamma-glutamyltransferase family protein, partial [Candidatus Krumholzibacteriia bacterium]